MKFAIVLLLSLTAVYNQGFQSELPVENLGNSRSPTQVRNPRFRRTPNPYYGLFNYMYASPHFNRPAAMTRRIGPARGVLRNQEQPARPTPTRAQAPAPQSAPNPQRAQAVQRNGAPTLTRNRGQALQNNLNPYGFGRGFGMFGALNGLNGLRDRSRLGGVGVHHGLNGIFGRHQDRSRRLDGIRGVGLGGGLYRAMSGSGWKSYGGSSGGKGSYYYRHPSTSGGHYGGHYGGSYKGSYYYRHGGGHGHGKYWSRR